MVFDFWGTDRDNEVAGGAPEEAPLVPRVSRVTAGGVERAKRFLRHPRVAGTSKELKIAFLEAKDCSPDEIDAALRAIGDDDAAAEKGLATWAKSLDDDDDPAVESAVAERGEAPASYNNGDTFVSLPRVPDSPARLPAWAAAASDEEAAEPKQARAKDKGGKKKRKKASRTEDRLAYRRRLQRTCAACTCCVFVVVPAVFLLFHFYDLDHNVTMIVKCLHTRC